VSFASITLCVASQRVFVVVYFIMTQSGNFWIHHRMYYSINSLVSVWTLNVWGRAAQCAWVDLSTSVKRKHVQAFEIPLYAVLLYIINVIVNDGKPEGKI
jgi:hypothetical protein